MAKQKKAKTDAKRKIRTKDHINEELSVNYVEKAALLNGYSVQVVDHDYGYDLIVFTYDRKGEIENGQIYFQLKAKQNVEFVKGGEFLSYSVSKRDLHLWKGERFPVIFVVYDVQNDVAYWLHVQDYIRNAAQKTNTQSLSLNIPRANLLNASAMAHIAAIKEKVQARIDKFLDNEDHDISTND